MSSARLQKLSPEDPESLTAKLERLLVGQDEAIETIVPYVQMHQAGLSPEGRPIGVVLLLGPTGTGKTRTVEALAEVLHGNSKSLLKVDCGEYQMAHEVAKIIGSPPGYLGHRETQPLLSQARVNGAASANNDISLVLLDEIEKAHESFNQLLLGILDKATLRLGDNTTVNFERCIIFMTSNLGARDIQRQAGNEAFGYESFLPKEPCSQDQEGLHSIGIKAVRRKFSPEFVNRVDSVITYRPLDRKSCNVILDHLLEGIATLILHRLGTRAFQIKVTRAGRRLLLDQGTSVQCGARELKRTVQRNLVQPTAAMVTQGSIPPGSTVILDAHQDEFKIFVRT